MRLRVIDFGIVSALRSQAAWYGVARELGGGGLPALVLALSREPYISIGLHQDAGRELDRDSCAANGLAVIRRRLGGGAVLIDRRQLIFHFVFPRRIAPSRPALLYPHFIEPVLRTYGDLGVAATFRPPNDIHVDGKKIGGTAAALFREAAVLGGTFLFDFDGALFARALKVPSEEFRERLKASVESHVTSMRRLLPRLPSRQEVKARFLLSVARCLGVEPVADRLRPAEREAMEEEEAHLSQPSWLGRAGRKFVPQGVKIAAGVYLTEGCHEVAGGLLRVRLLECEGRIADLELFCDFDCGGSRALLALASRLKGSALDGGALAEKLASTMAELGIETSGVNAENVAAAIAAARQREP